MRAPVVSTLLGFFNRQGVDIDGKPSYRLFFVPPPEGSVLGAQRRLLTSIVDGLPDDDTHIVNPLAARHGLVLVRLLTGIRRHESVHMAVCDPFARTCHLLPPLECKVSFVSCTFLTGAECRQHHRSLDYFKVLAVVSFDNPKGKDDRERNLYTFSSTESSWSAPRKCFDEVYRPGKRGFRFPQISSGNNALCGTTAHWLVSYHFGHLEEPTKYYTLDVSSDTGHTSLTELPTAVSRHITYSNSRSTLGVTADGALSLFCIDEQALMRRIDVWKRGNDVDNQVWLHSRVIELPSQTKHLYHLSGVHMLSVEKSDTLLVIDDESQCVHKVNVETGVVEEQQFQNGLNSIAMPMNMDWPTWFASRLG
ncbi:hypothetical protein CFC21_037638 [Triticum aestivum]|uniref:F-box associated domain-containing protein n=2 Tax=Triticum aestivum TaxID=4565 RepID=A0A9R1JPZ3_WHEAT|nr:hypothetical protein CFC21_037638 [Triticum aestivum]